MKVNFIELFSTPLDIGHSKVIDIVGDNLTEEEIKTIYKETLERDYTKEVVASNLVRSVKMIGKRCELVIFKNYLDLQKYNYILINDLYFFIESVTSNNDSDTNPSSSLTLVWDYWANNLTSIYNSYDSYTNITNRHIDRFDNDEKLYYKNEDVNISHIEKELISTEPYKVLFIKLTVSNSMFYNDVPYDNGEILVDDVPKFRYSYPNRDGTFTEKTGSPVGIDNQDNVIDLYIPIRVLNVNTLKFETKKVSVRHYYSDDLNEDVEDIYYTTIYHNTKFSLDTILSEHILRASFTYNCPYDYSYNSVTDSIVFYETSAILLNGEITGNEDFKYYPLVTMSRGVLFGLNYNSRIYNRFDEELSFNYDFYIENSTRAPSLVDSIRATDNGYDPKLYMYPFAYIKLKVGSDEIIISPNRKKFKNVKLIIFKKISDCPSYCITVDENTYTSLIRTFIDSTPTISFSTLSVDDYTLRNGTQNKINDTFNVIKNYIGTVSSIISSSPKHALQNSVSGAIGTGTSLIETMLKRQAIIKDISNLPDIIHNPPLGEYDTINVDRFILLICEMCDCNYYDIKKEEFRVYGYELDTIGNPFENYRVWFDFVSCNNCKLNLSINNEDRIELENMFNRGVHKFHIHAEDTTIFKSSLSLDPTGYNNIEISLWKGEE